MRAPWSYGYALAIIFWFLAPNKALADGCFVSVWDKHKDINEPTQKAIILYDQGQEDLVLQVKYEGPAEDFGWLVPVPGLPEIKKGSMDCYYELSRLLPEYARGHTDGMALESASSRGKEEKVKVIETKTVGAYEIAVLSTKNARSLTEWLDAHHFAFPKGKQDILDGYIKKQWYFVAARVNPTGHGFALKPGKPEKRSISSSTRKKLATGELHPLVISFPSEKCVFPLAISAVNGKPSEVSLYVLASEPLLSRVICDKRLEADHREREEWNKHRVESRNLRRGALKNMKLLNMAWLMYSEVSSKDPTDPRPNVAAMERLVEASHLVPPAITFDEEFEGRAELLRSLEVRSKDLPACSKTLPRLTGKSWWLTKQIETFPPNEMRDLYFEPALSILAETLYTPDGQRAAFYLEQIGTRSVPVLLAALKSNDPKVRRFAATAASRIKDPRLAAPLREKLRDSDAQTRAAACESFLGSWDTALTPRLVELLRDEDVGVQQAAQRALATHKADSESHVPTYRQMLKDSGWTPLFALRMLETHGVRIPRAELIPLLSSTNLDLVFTTFRQLRTHDPEVGDVEPLMKHPLPWARLHGLSWLAQQNEKEAVERIVRMLRDPDEVIRWRARACLRWHFQQSLGPDPVAYEKWWEKNKATFTRRTASSNAQRGVLRPDLSTADEPVLPERSLLPPVQTKPLAK